MRSTKRIDEYPIRLRMAQLTICAIVCMLYCTAWTQQVYVTAGDPGQLYIMDLSNDCSLELVGNIVDENGNTVSPSDVAICPDGTMYITDFVSLFELDPSTARATFITTFNPFLELNSLVCDDALTLYGAGPDEVYAIDKSSGAVANLGSLPFLAVPSGDLVFSNGELYVATLFGLFQVDLTNPQNSIRAVNTGFINFFGLAPNPLECNAIIASSPAGQIISINLVDESLSTLCNTGLVITGMTSLDEFDNPASPSDTTFVNNITCDPSEVGLSSQTLTNVFGCDSTIVTETSLSIADTVFVEISSCDPGEVGTVTQDFVSQTGCDSTVITTTLLLRSDSVFLDEVSCDPGDEGIVIQTFSNQFGCDSVVITSTTVVITDTTLIETSSCDPTEEGVLEEIFLDQTGCDSVVVIITEFVPPDTLIIEDESCDPAETGTSIVVLTNAGGCDSVIISRTFLAEGGFSVNEISTCDPLEVGTVEAVFAGANGCDSIVQTITTLRPDADCEREEGQVYIPNVFSPNSDGVNDLFYIFGNDAVEVIDNFQIFNRWGALVYEVADVMPNDPGTAWDGTSNGEALNADVYIYWAEVRMSDGSQELVKGDVTLVR